MATEAAVKPTATGNGRLTETTQGNIYQRINAALVEMGDLETDKVHPHHKFPYVSVGKLLANWRHVSVKHGIRTSMTFIEKDALELRFINIDDPADREVSQWPLYAEDKGWSYTAKYALMKALMVADDEEPDERPVQTAPSPRASDATSAGMGGADYGLGAPWKAVAPAPATGYEMRHERDGSEDPGPPCPTENCTGHLVQRATKTGNNPGSPYLVCDTGRNGCGLSPLWDTTIESYRSGEEELGDVTVTRPSADVDYIVQFGNAASQEDLMEAFSTGALIATLSKRGKDWFVEREKIEHAPQDRLKAVRSVLELQIEKASA